MTGPVADIIRLRSLELRTPTVAEAADFYASSWGLSVIDRDGQDTWLRSSGPDHHVLSLRSGPSNTLGKLSFALAAPRDVDAAAERLAARGLPILCEPGPGAGPEGGYALATCDLEGRVVELVAETLAVPAGPLDRSTPLGVTHVVLNTTDIDAAASFWCDVLGFRVSDWSEHQMVFLRCNAYHHTIAFNQAEWASVNHVAYEMADVDGFMRGIGRLRHHGTPIGWGPGRHGPGDNTFSYFVDPAGFVCEYTAEVQRIDEATWLPRVWRRIPELSDLWGTAGPPSTGIRTSMAGTKDVGVFAEQPGLQSRFVEALGRHR
jgi:catechol 2,3-dioxygenase-like lactoylglutathione lyase family enzyme